MKFSTIRDTSRTVTFFDASLFWEPTWHYNRRGNFCFADGHVDFALFPENSEVFRW